MVWGCGVGALDGGGGGRVPMSHVELTNVLQLMSSCRIRWSTPIDAGSEWKSSQKPVTFFIPNKCARSF